jgi:hypothetical protein
VLHLHLGRQFFFARRIPFLHATLLRRARDSLLSSSTTSSIGSSPRVMEFTAASRLRLCRFIKSHEESIAATGRLRRRHRHRRWLLTLDPTSPLDPPLSREARRCRCFQFDRAMHTATAVPVRSQLDLFRQLGSAQLCVDSAPW